MKTLCCIPFLAASLCLALSAHAAAANRPNVLLILADDMGFSDIGCYGGEIPTPNIDSLATHGLRFTQFYNTARCSPTRAALLTGLLQHQAGMGILGEDPNQQGPADAAAGYTRFLNRNCVTIAEVLKSAGYRTYMAGKWHLGYHGQEKWPLQRGFERYYGILAGASSYFRPQGGRGLTLDNTPLPPPTDPNYYTTDAFADHLIQFIKEQQEDRPFFGYLAFNAPHWPLHGRPEDIAKFVGKYTNGWDQVRVERWARQRSQGIVKEKWGLSPRDDGARAWGALTDEQKRQMDYRMAVYAAQVHRMDYQVGRVLESLRVQGRLDNTIVIFLSDNGGCAEPYRDLGGGTFEQINDPNNSGAVSYGTGWANASNTPFRRYKARLYEGGIATPLIVHWPAGLKTRPGSLCDTRGFLSDIMPTLLELTGAKYPAESNGHPITPFYGRSFAPVLKGGTLPQPEWMFWEHYSDRAARKDDWKILGRMGSDKWELYNLADDRTEQHDLAADKPELVRELAAAWQKWAETHQVLPRFLGTTRMPEPPKPLALSDDFSVSVDARPLTVFKSTKTGNHGTHDVTAMSFAGFDLANPSTVRVTPKRVFRTHEVRPYAAGIPSVVKGGVIEFTLKQPQHVVITLDGSYQGVLVLSANPPAAVPEPKSVSHFFGPGVHRIGHHVPLQSGDDVYLAEGAMVVGSFSLDHVENVNIRGRGLLALGEFPHQEDYRVFRGEATRNVLIEGITVCDAPGWIISFWGGNTNLTVRNVKMVGNWRYNTDGVQTGTEGLLVEDCFMQCNDDNFSLNGVCRDVVVRRNVLWNLYNGGVFMLGWATGQQFDLHHLDIHDNTILRAGGCCDYDPKGPFSMKLFGSHRRAEDIRFRNIVVEDLAPYGRWLDFQAEKARASVVKDIRFENVEVQKAWKVAAELRGSADSPIEAVCFKDVRILGRPMTDPTAGGLDLVNTRGVTIEGQVFGDAVVVGPLTAGVVPRKASSRPDGPIPTNPPAAVGAPTRGNLLANPTFSQGAKAWTCAGSPVSVIDVDGGTAAAVPARQCIEQDVTTVLLAQGQGAYTYGASVRASADDAAMKVTLRIEDPSGTQLHTSPDVIASSTAWTSAARTQSFHWTNLKRASLLIESGGARPVEGLVREAWLTR